jgi:hypothetical protein
VENMAPWRHFWVCKKKIAGRTIHHVRRRAVCVCPVGLESVCQVTGWIPIAT